MNVFAEGLVFAPPSCLSNLSPLPPTLPLSSYGLLNIKIKALEKFWTPPCRLLRTMRLLLDNSALCAFPLFSFLRPPFLLPAPPPHPFPPRGMTWMTRLRLCLLPQLLSPWQCSLFSSLSVVLFFCPVLSWVASFVTLSSFLPHWAAPIFCYSSQMLSGPHIFRAPSPNTLPSFSPASLSWPTPSLCPVPPRCFTLFPVFLWLPFCLILFTLAFSPFFNFPETRGPLSTPFTNLLIHVIFPSFLNPNCLVRFYLSNRLLSQFNFFP